ncbi:MAG: hypothetical protein K2I78_04160 [Clostridia bacterium]|nr:hypothetical protein [Clostridia bacterium]MDE7215725.1 hypothetical protein [Clostridia bacterium]
MKIYELIFIFLIGAALGVIVRYVAGYRRRHIPYATLNVLLGGAACITSCALYGSDFFEIFLSGVGGVIGNLAYIAVKLISALTA